MNEIQKLEELIKRYDNAYYNQDESLVSDAEYDALKAKLLELTGLDEIDYIPGEAIKGDKHEHSISILSLEKVQITDDEGLTAHLERLWPVAIQKKYDGLTDVFYGEQGVHATRGNGFVGENITETVTAGVEGIGKTQYTVRGEILMPIHTFHKLNRKRVAQGLEPHKNPRNTAAGMLRNLDVSKVEGLKFFAYDIIIKEGTIPYKTQLELLKAQGFNVADTFIPETIEEAVAYIKNFDRATLDYEIDGLVVKHIGHNLYGATGHHPKNAIAIKFAQEGVWTKLHRIRWQVGRTGKQTPVADFEPIELLGAEVAKASLHNHGIIEAYGLDYNYLKMNEENGLKTIDRDMYSDIEVKVIKANEIIPQIIDVRHLRETEENKEQKMHIPEPSTCAECGSPTEKEEDQRFCHNDGCPAKIVAYLAHIAKRDALDIEGLSEETAKKFIDYRRDQIRSIFAQIENSEEAMTEEDQFDDEYFKEKEELELRLAAELDYMHPSFIYNFTLKDIQRALGLTGLTMKSADNLFNAIEKSKKVDFHKFLYATGIPLLGRSVSKLIAEHYQTVEAFVNGAANDFKDLEKVNGIGKEIINSLKNNYDKMLLPFGEVDFEIEEPKIVEIEGGKNLKIVITGKFEISRDEIKTIIEGLGSKVVGSVSKATDYLLASPGEESTTKYKKAESLGVKIINSISDLREKL